MSDSSELKVKWFGCQSIWDSNYLVVNRCVLQMILVVCWFELQVRWLSIDLRFNWFGRQSIWDSNDLVVNRFEIQVSWLSIDLRFKWFVCQSMCDWFCLSVDFGFKWVGCQLIWDSYELVANWFEIQAIWLSNDLRFKWVGCQLMCDSKYFVKRSFSARLPSILKLWSSKTKHFCETSFKKWSFEAQKRSFSARLPSKLKRWSSKTKLFCETSFKNRNFETPKRSLSARLPSKMKLGRSRTKLFCETSFKIEALKLKNDAFLRDFLQKQRFEDQKRSFSARLPSKLKLWSSKTKRFCETSFKIDILSRHLTSEFQYVLVIFMWMLQKYCACHEKVAPRHTKSCNCHAKWSLQSNTSVTWNLQPFHGFSVGGFKHRHHRARNHCACHAKRIVPDPLQIHHACQRFCNPHELLRLPRILQRVEIPAPATRNTLWTSKNVPRPSVFNDFDCQIALVRRRGANFDDFNFQKWSEPLSF